MNLVSLSFARPVIYLGLLVLTVGLAGCPKEAAPTQDAVPAAPSTVGVAAVAAAGTTFDPAVKKTQIPDGAYICDMGTVHYAALEEGDGKCPRCGMPLKKHVAHAQTP